MGRLSFAAFAALTIAMFVPLSLAVPLRGDDAAPVSDESPADEHHDEHADSEHHADEDGHDGAHGEAGHGDHGGAHGHHNEFDLSHGNPGAALEDPTEVKSDLAVWTFVVFLLLLAILTKFAWGPIMAGLDKREQAIAGSIEEAQRIKDEAQKISSEYDAKLNAAAEEVRAMLDEARRDADATKQRIVAEAQEAANEERSRALRDIELAKYEALHELKQSSVDMAFGLARNVVKKEINSADHANLVQEAMENLPGPQSLN